GFTFEENAVSKAVGYAALTGMVSLADDSGLAVDALGGRPGIHSARYAGEATPFEEKIKKLLSELLRTSGGGRSASFVSAMAIADADGSVLCRSKGICTGMIAPAPSGSGGFGYDPIFIPDGYSNTFAELPDAVKNKISHRARAFEEIIPFLRDYMAV
ncbi:MAG: non-canonical purine NTP pyrophosphatase, partial [Pyrinomonadaceae bacterium]